MKTSHVFKLDEWVSRNKTWIMTGQPTLSEIRGKAQNELDFKCPTEPIKSCMERNEIPVRRSKHEAEKLLLELQVRELTDLVEDLVAHSNLPPDVLSKLRDRGTNLSTRAFDALSRNASA